MIQCCQIDKEAMVRWSPLYIVFVWVVLLMGGGATIVNDIDPRSNPLGVGITLFCCVYLLNKSRSLPGNSKSIYVFALAFLWLIIHFFTDTLKTYPAYLSTVINLVFAYGITRTYSSKILDYYIDVLYRLSTIGLLFWVLECAVGVNALNHIAPFEFSQTGDKGSFLIFNVSPGLRDGSSLFGLVRNCGCAWEPGRYAVMTLFALSGYIVNQRGSFKFFDKRVVVFLISIFSTFSTTGYYATIIMFAMHFLVCSNKSFARRFLWALILAIICFYVSTLPFMGDKLERNMTKDYFVTERSDVANIDQTITVDRTEGLYLDWLNIIHAPLIGTGPDSYNSYMKLHINRCLVTSNGILKPIAMFGIPLGLLFFLFFYNSLVLIVRFKGYRFGSFLFVTIIVFSYSYNLTVTALMQSLALFLLFASPQSIQYMCNETK